jgi:hypothetical protein
MKKKSNKLTNSEFLEVLKRGPQPKDDKRAWFIWLSFFFVLFVGYLVTAFIMWEFSPNAWGPFVRGVACVVSLVTAASVSIYTAEEIEF